MTAKLTPMMQQYQAVKRQHPDKIVFFRMGDFYEMFFEDAREAARVLGIALTSRDKGTDPVPMAGVPHHALDAYLDKMVASGHRVVICDQVEDPALAVGLVKREVTRIITPGTYYNEKSDDARANVFLAALWPGPETAGVAWVDLSTGEFFAGRVPAAEAAGELATARVQECLVPEGADGADAGVAAEIGGERITRVPDWTFEFAGANRRLCEQFGVAALDGFGFGDLPGDPAIRAAGAVLQYLVETQKNQLGHIVRLAPVVRTGILQIDRATQSSLELVETQRTRQKQGSLFGVLDFTRTAMGARKLKQFILRPVTDCREIFERQEAVRAFKEDDLLREETRERLAAVYDLERLVGRAAAGRANARDLVCLRTSLEAADRVRGLLADAFARRLMEVREGLAPDAALVALIAARLVDDPPLAVTEGGLIRAGVHPELDELRTISRDGKRWIADYQEQERARTGIDKLRVGFNQVFGYYIEVTNLHKDRAPADYTRRQTLANCERFITPALKEYEQKVLTAEERICKIEYDLFQETRAAVAVRAASILALAGRVAELDVYCALGTAARKYGFVAPVVDDGPLIVIEAGRHPVLEQALPGGQFVPNDLRLEAGTPFLIITGPNMAGKSTYIRQAAVIVLMAQMGGFVPATRALVGVADRIFTRIGATDELARGQSTFMVEMTEVANILNNATARSLVILDEVGRGTSTFDGVSIAWAIAEHIMARVGARTLFATHYHELTELEVVGARARNLNVAVEEHAGRVVFLHRIVPGAADKSYGIHVAEIAGLPPSVLARAREVLANLERDSFDEHHQPRLAGHASMPDPEPVQLSLFDMHNDRVIKRLREADPEHLTPLAALNLLSALKKELG
ncbi:MAG: DNA mismatch repair protein MutS [Planctomycetota bacterium]